MKKKGKKEKNVFERKKRQVIETGIGLCNFKYVKDLYSNLVQFERLKPSNR